MAIQTETHPTLYWWDVNVQDWRKVGSLLELKSEPGFAPNLCLFYQGEVRPVPTLLQRHEWPGMQVVPETLSLAAWVQAYFARCRQEVD